MGVGSVYIEMIVAQSIEVFMAFSVRGFVVSILMHLIVES